MEYDKREVETENNTEVDTYWIDSQTDFPIAQRLVDAKGRVSEATRNNLDGTYYRIKYLYDTDDGGEAVAVLQVQRLPDRWRAAARSSDPAARLSPLRRRRRGGCPGTPCARRVQ